jgi:hypothetical protein
VHAQQRLRVWHFRDSSCRFVLAGATLTQHDPVGASSHIMHQVTTITAHICYITYTAHLKHSDALLAPCCPPCACSLQPPVLTARCMPCQQTMRSDLLLHAQTAPSFQCHSVLYPCSRLRQLADSASQRAVDKSRVWGLYCIDARGRILRGQVLPRICGKQRQLSAEHCTRIRRQAFG